MSEFVKCKTCVGASGFLDKMQKNICTTCHGSGRLKKRQRGFHLGDNGEKIGIGTAASCPLGHIKTGIGVDDFGNLRTFCEICHRRVVAETKRRQKEKIA